MCLSSLVILPSFSGEETFFSLNLELTESAGRLTNDRRYPSVLAPFPGLVALPPMSDRDPNSGLHACGRLFSN